MGRNPRDVGRLVVAALVAGAASFAPTPSAAQNFFDFLFNGGQQQKPQRQQQQQQQPNFDPFGLFTSQQPAPPPRPAAASGGGAAFCVRSCDGRYFPMQNRSGVTPAQMCQAFCPASATRVFFGGSIDNASASNGERYAESANAFAYRKALKADCTCNGRDPAGLAPIDLSLDTSLRAGDVIATASGLFAYSGVRLGASQTPEYTPIASFPGLTADIRARLGEMKVAPVSAEIAGDEGTSDANAAIPAETPAPKPAPAAKPGKRAAIH